MNGDHAMRICSLVPGATEVIASLGLADQLIGISHECDFPSSVRHVPVMIEPLVGAEPASSMDIDRKVKALVAAGQRLYRLKEQAFREAQPDIILTQDLCHVCAVTPDQLTGAIRSLPRQPIVLTLSPTSLDGMITDIERIAQTVHRTDKGQALVQSLRERLARVRAQAAASSRPRVVCLEWLDPLYLAGHWVPEMVEQAGGQDVLGSADDPSRETTWNEVQEARPDIVLLMPCGYTIDRTVKELARPGRVHEEWTRAVNRWPQTYVVDAASYFSRPGPRLLDGVKLLAAILHPRRSRPLDPAKARRLEAAALAMGFKS